MGQRLALTLRQTCLGSAKPNMGFGREGGR